VKTISINEPDWSREKPLRFWDPSRKLLGSIRRYQKYKDRDGILFNLVCKINAIQHTFWSIVTGADIPLNSQLGGGLLIPHPNGVVISPRAEIGVNCLIFQQVTLGSRGDGAPIIGGHVDIGAGAKILGKVVLGDNVKIGANAVVIGDVPSGCTAVGIPATIIGK
jgi:serine O-acetyltransferase